MIVRGIARLGEILTIEWQLGTIAGAGLATAFSLEHPGAKLVLLTPVVSLQDPPLLQLIEQSESAS